MAATENKYTIRMLNVFPFLKSLGANTTGLRMDSTNVRTMPSVFSDFIEEWGWDGLSVLPEIVGRAFLIKHIVKWKHYI